MSANCSNNEFFGCTSCKWCSREVTTRITWRSPFCRRVFLPFAGSHSVQIRLINGCNVAWLYPSWLSAKESHRGKTLKSLGLEVLNSFLDGTQHIKWCLEKKILSEKAKFRYVFFSPEWLIRREAVFVGMNWEQAFIKGLWIFLALSVGHTVLEGCMLQWYSCSLLAAVLKMVLYVYWILWWT